MCIFFFKGKDKARVILRVSAELREFELSLWTNTTVIASGCINGKRINTDKQYTINQTISSLLGYSPMKINLP